ncbi:small nuclear ribonucleoprotein B (nucleomorph) [Lotharella oceanica]|uniref:Small nuclear ribonucleoprotein B n=1 Tax=Lotharella oceanica TaxID=641309 RepID=A0A060DG72_9EUKA|nr:small nuclear ribonucleoprotein B [Lotharella oceanica]
MVDIKSKLRRFINKKINVRVNNSKNIIGILLSYDKFMNIVVTNAEEVDNNKKLNEKKIKNLGLVVLRGSEIIFIFTE